MTPNSLRVPDDAKIKLWNTSTCETVVITGKEYNQLPYYVRLMWSQRTKPWTPPYPTKGGGLK